ncbi:MAG: aminotransferase class I/II-fold pyridoxal phosphate-dependent enzyme, partial [Bosea sp. (in: a-proteobacteria)]
GMRADFQRSRDRFADGLSGLGFSVLPSAATYFLNIDIAPLGESDDVAFCERLVTQHGVAAIPVSAFYANKQVGNIVRFCFAKRDDTLDAALERLSGLVR